MVKHLATAKDYYDELSIVYDIATGPLGVWNAPLESAKALRFAVQRRSCLIVGVGTGQDIPAVIENGFLDITGIDISSRMIDVCAKKFPKVEYIVGEVTAIPMKRFDLIVCSGMAEFTQDIDLLIQEISKLMNKCGVLIFTFEPILEASGEQSKRISVSRSVLKNLELITYRWSKDEVLKMVDTHGLEVVENKEYLAYMRGGESVTYNLLVLKNKGVRCELDYELQ